VTISAIIRTLFIAFSYLASVLKRAPKGLARALTPLWLVAMTVSRFAVEVASTRI
jgi:hypothetical protein